MPRASRSPLTGNLRGLLLIAASALGFSAMHAMIRFLAGDIHPFEIAFFRNFFGIAVLVPLLLRTGAKHLKTDRFPMHLLRAVLQLASMLLFFSAIAISPLAKISAMSFSAPLFASIGAILFLGEAIRLPRVVALVLGFTGALIVAQPGTEMEPGMVLALLSSVVWAIAILVIKTIARTDSSVTLALYMGILMAPMSLIPAVFVWTWPSPVDYFWLFLMGTTGTVSHLAMAEALKIGDASVVMPADFSRLLWASALGWIFFSQVPSTSAWIGGTLIFLSATFIGIREARAARTASSPFEALDEASSEDSNQP